MFRWIKFLFFLLILLIFALPFHESWFSISCLQYHVSIQSLSPSVTEDLAFFLEVLVVSAYLGPLVNHFVNLLYPTICKPPVSTYRWTLPLRPESVQLDSKMVMSRRTPLNIYIRGKCIKLKCFGPKWVFKRVCSSRIINFDDPI